MGMKEWKDRVLLCRKKVVLAHFKHKNICKYVSVTRGQNGMEVMRSIDFVLIRRELVKYDHLPMMWRQMGRGISRHSATLYKLKLMGT